MLHAYSLIDMAWYKYSKESILYGKPHAHFLFILILQNRNRIRAYTVVIGNPITLTTRKIRAVILVPVPFTLTDRTVYSTVRKRNYGTLQNPMQKSSRCHII